MNFNGSLNRGKKHILFYDENQSIKPSDVDKEDFQTLKSKKDTEITRLKSQFRVKGGNGYVAFVDNLLNAKINPKAPVYSSKDYEFLLFDSLEPMIEQIKEKEAEHGLCRLVAGYSWKWASKNQEVHDIEIEGLELTWNSVASDWVNSENSINEVGCIHTTQGYDLNYTGIIFGNEITYDKHLNEIRIIEENYYDINGKQSIKDPEELKKYIINIYKTIMLRGIQGTYVYVCDKDLREYFKQHIQLFVPEVPFKILPIDKVNPYVNSVPLVNFSAAAGLFSELQQISEFEWIELPPPFKPQKDYFVCKVVGESMNKKIPNGAWCLFQRDPGGSREGKIVLVEHYSIQDADFGAGFTVKSYHSKKEVQEDRWWHSGIILKPLSDDENYKDIVLEESELDGLKVVGVFVGVVG